MRDEYYHAERALRQHGRQASEAVGSGVPPMYVSSPAPVCRASCPVRTASRGQQTDALPSSPARCTARPAAIVGPRGAQLHRHARMPSGCTLAQALEAGQVPSALDCIGAECIYVSGVVLGAALAGQLLLSADICASASRLDPISGEYIDVSAMDAVCRRPQQLGRSRACLRRLRRRGNARCAWIRANWTSPATPETASPPPNGRDAGGRHLRLLLSGVTEEEAASLGALRHRHASAFTASGTDSCSSVPRPAWRRAFPRSAPRSTTSTMTRATASASPPATCWKPTTGGRTPPWNCPGPSRAWTPTPTSPCTASTPFPRARTAWSSSKCAPRRTRPFPRTLAARAASRVGTRAEGEELVHTAILSDEQAEAVFEDPVAAGFCRNARGQRLLTP